MTESTNKCKCYSDSTLYLKCQQTQWKQIIGSIDDDDITEQLKVSRDSLHQVLSTDVDSTQIWRVFHAAVLQLDMPNTKHN